MNTIPPEFYIEYLEKNDIIRNIYLLISFRSHYLQEFLAKKIGCDTSNVVKYLKNEHLCDLCLSRDSFPINTYNVHNHEQQIETVFRCKNCLDDITETICKSEAKKLYHVTDKILSKLSYETKPHKGKWGVIDLCLYNVKDVIQYATLEHEYQRNKKLKEETKEKKIQLRIDRIKKSIPNEWMDSMINYDIVQEYVYKNKGRIRDVAGRCVRIEERKIKVDDVIKIQKIPKYSDNYQNHFQEQLNIIKKKYTNCEIDENDLIEWCLKTKVEIEQRNDRYLNLQNELHKYNLKIRVDSFYCQSHIVNNSINLETATNMMREMEWYINNNNYQYEYKKVKKNNIFSRNIQEKVKLDILFNLYKNGLQKGKSFTQIFESVPDFVSDKYKSSLLSRVYWDLWSLIKNYSIEQYLKFIDSKYHLSVKIEINRDKKQHLFRVFCQNLNVNIHQLMESYWIHPDWVVEINKKINKLEAQRTKNIKKKPELKRCYCNNIVSSKCTNECCSLCCPKGLHSCSYHKKF